MRWCSRSPAAATGIRTAGIVAALSGAVWFDYFLTAPFTTFAITDRADVETAVLLVLVGLAVTEVALWGRRQQARASREQGYLDGVVSTAASVGAGLPTGSLVERAASRSPRCSSSTAAGSTSAPSRSWRRWTTPAP
jgi:K+-sensing histidine kinase KdpD